MSKKSGNDQEYTNKPQNVKIAFYAVFIAAIFLFELYLMICDSTDFILLGIVGFILLIFLYLLINLLYQVNVQKERRREEQYENIFKSEKASYMVLRKNFNELNEKVNHLIDNGKIPMEEMIQAQKAIAKVTINRNKENANAMLNSNDRLLEQVMIFDKKLNEIDHSIGERQKSVADQSNKEVFLKQNEIVSSIKQLELTLKNEILKAVNDIHSQGRYGREDITYQEDTASTQRTAFLMEEQAPELELEPEPIKDPALELPDAEAESYDNVEYGDELSAIISEPDTEPEIELEDDIASNESDQEIETVFPDLEIPVTEDKQTEIEAEPELELPELDQELDLDPDPEMPELDLDLEPEMPELDLDLEPEVPELDLDLEPEMPELDLDLEPEIPELDLEPEPEEVELPEPEPESEPEAVAAEVIPPMPDLSNPNKVMSPDEISALFANTVDAGATLEEPTKEEPPVQEEKPPMPDLSNPNKVMTPEEIAALLANI